MLAYARAADKGAVKVKASEAPAMGVRLDQGFFTCAATSRDIEKARFYAP